MRRSNICGEGEEPPWIIGQHYSESDGGRITKVKYKGTWFHIKENRWSDEWQVSLDTTEYSEYPLNDAEELYESLLIRLHAVRVLMGLGYEYSTTMEPGVAVWWKPTKTFK